MRSCKLLAVIFTVSALCFAGCGGGGGQAPPPPVLNFSSIEGEVDIQGAAGEYELLLDGRPIPGALQDDGTYAIENVTPGRHRVGVVARDGMEGGYATVEVPEGELVRAPRIVPDLGGQIVGIVTVIEDGVVRPLEGVEVLAQPALMPVPAEEAAGDAPAIYPPPEDLPGFSTFTDADGSFLIRAVPRGEYTVSVTQPDMEHAWQWVRVEAGRTAVADFRLRPSIEPGVGTVRGRVMGTQGGMRGPVVGARVTIISDSPWRPIGPPDPPVPEPPVPEPPAPEPPLPEPLEDGGTGIGESEPGAPAMPDPGRIAPPYFEEVSTVTNPLGEYSLNAPAGYASIHVYEYGWEPAWQEIRILPGESLTVNFELGDIDIWPPPPGVEEGGQPPSPPESGVEQPPIPNPE